MVRGPDGEKVRFGIAEWVGLISVTLIVVGGWIDVRVQQAVAVHQISELKIQTGEVLKDHEQRIRALERVERK